MFLFAVDKVRVFLVHALMGVHSQYFIIYLFDSLFRNGNLSLVVGSDFF